MGSSGGEEEEEGEEGKGAKSSRSGDASAVCNCKHNLLDYLLFMFN